MSPHGRPAPILPPEGERAGAGAARVIHIEAEAPPKPAVGQPCNGCGICCLAEPCPIGVLLSIRTRGPCRMLRWSALESRYVCGSLRGSPAMLRPLLRRWIAAGQGCDCELESTGMP